MSDQLTHIDDEPASEIVAAWKDHPNAWQARRVLLAVADTRAERARKLAEAGDAEGALAHAQAAEELRRAADDQIRAPAYGVADLT